MSPDWVNLVDLRDDESGRGTVSSFAFAPYAAVRRKHDDRFQWCIASWAGASPSTSLQLSGFWSYAAVSVLS
jgi:hypothetical protein